MNAPPMNRATQVALEFMLGQMNGLSLIENAAGEVNRDIWNIQSVKGYYEAAVEDFPEQYDEDFFSLWYMDKRSPCIDWQVVADAVQEDRDDLYLECLFD
jgi:hypothetical protein